MRKSLNIKNILIVCMLAAPAVSSAQQRAAVGPVEVIEGARSSVTVLGQKFSINRATRFAVDGRELPASRAARAIFVGQNVYVEAMDGPTGSIATLVSISTESYVPGSSSVYVLGTVDGISTAMGIIRIGSLNIDSSDVTPEILANIRIGSPIEVFGVQPLPAGTVVGVTRLIISGTPQTLGSTELKKPAVVGPKSQKQSIGGSGEQIQGTDGLDAQKLSIGGSGMQTQSIGGSGIQIQSIGGSGIQSQSIGGSGSL